MNRYLKYLCILIVFPLFFSGCAPEPAPVSTGSAPFQGFELFEAMGISEDLISRSRRDTLTGSEGSFTEYSLDDSQHRLVLRVNGDNQIIYVLHEIKEPENHEQPVELTELMPHISALREAYGTEDYQYRTDIWDEYTDGDASVTLEYTREYDGVYNYSESMAFRLDLLTGTLLEYSWVNEPPLDTAVELSPEEAEELAAEQMEAEIYLPFAMIAAN